MIEIIPAIMPKDVEDLKEKVALVADYVDIVQLDIMDGEFVPDKTWPYLTSVEPKEIEDIRSIQDVKFEFDLMTFDADKKTDFWMGFKPKRLIFHIEAVENLKMFLEEELKAYLKEEDEKVEIGIAINTTTSIDKTFPFVESGLIDFVQCMGIGRIGFQGQPFDERVIDHISRLREEYPRVTISVDGGVKMDTAPQLIGAGVNRLVAGSAIFGAYNIEEAIKEFQKL